MSKRVYVCVSGGVVDVVVVPPVTDGTWTVIDWDNIEGDPEREWLHFDEEARAYIVATYPEEVRRYFPKYIGSVS